MFPGRFSPVNEYCGIVEETEYYLPGWWKDERMESPIGEPDKSLQLAAAGIRRIRWGSEHLAKVEESGIWESKEFTERVGVYRNEEDMNLYHFMVTRSLKTATRSFQGAQHLLPAPYGAIPVEVLLRTGLLASAKALYLLQPNKRPAREKRAFQLYRADRSSLDHAVTSELKLIGDTDTISEQRRPQVIQETKILRDALDDLLVRGNCSCGDSGCPEYDLEAQRHRIMRLWWNYSSVAHINVWHIEKTFEPAPSGAGHTTGDIGLALYDLGWLYMQSVGLFFERYDLLEDLEPLIV